MSAAVSDVATATATTVAVADAQKTLAFRRAVRPTAAPTVRTIKLRTEKRSVGFNASQRRIEDMLEAGIIDPTKVVRTALQNAASIAGLLLTTEAVVTELPEKAAALPGGEEHD